MHTNRIQFFHLPGLTYPNTSSLFLFPLSFLRFLSQLQTPFASNRRPAVWEYKHLFAMAGNTYTAFLVPMVRFRRACVYFCLVFPIVRFCRILVMFPQTIATKLRADRRIYWQGLSALNTRPRFTRDLHASTPNRNHASRIKPAISKASCASSLNAFQYFMPPTS